MVLLWVLKHFKTCKMSKVKSRTSIDENIVFSDLRYFPHDLVWPVSGISGYTLLVVVLPPMLSMGIGFLDRRLDWNLDVARSSTDDTEVATATLGL